MAETVIAETLVVESDVVLSHSDHWLLVVLQSVLIVPDAVVEPTCDVIKFYIKFLTVGKYVSRNLIWYTYFKGDILVRVKDVVVGPQPRDSSAQVIPKFLT